MLHISVLSLMLLCVLSFASHITIALFVLYAIISSGMSTKNWTPTIFFLFVAGLSVVLHMHELYSHGPSMLYTEKHSPRSSCVAQQISTTERFVFGQSNCQPLDYAASKINQKTLLRKENDKKSGRLYRYIDTANVLASCDEGGFECFDFSIYTSDGVKTKPPFSAIQEIKVRGSSEVYAVPFSHIPILTTSNDGRKHTLPGGFNLSHAEKCIVNQRGIVSLRPSTQGTDFYTWMVGSFLTVPMSANAEVSMSVTLSRTCNSDKECRNLFTPSHLILSLSSAARMSAFTLVSQLLACRHDEVTDCEENAVAAILSFIGNLSAIVLMIIGVSRFKGHARPASISSPVALAFYLGSLNIITPARDFGRARFQFFLNCLILALEVIQGSLAFYILVQFNFGSNRDYMLRKIEFVENLYLIFPFLLFDGNVFLTNTIIICICSWASLIKEAAQYVF